MRLGQTTSPYLPVLLEHLNRAQDVVRAWELYEHEFQRPSKMRDEAMLDHLLPPGWRHQEDEADLQRAAGPAQ